MDGSDDEPAEIDDVEDKVNCCVLAVAFDDDAVNVDVVAAAAAAVAVAAAMREDNCAMQLSRIVTVCRLRLPDMRVAVLYLH